MKRSFLALLLVLSCLPVFAQQAFTDSLRSATSREEQKRWNLFRNELGFTIDNLLLSGGYGTTLLFKRRYESGKLVRVKRTQALRFIAAVSIDKALSEPNPDPWYVYDNDNRVRVYAAIGQEFQNNLGRFQFFYGLDLYAQYIEHTYVSRSVYYNPTSQISFTHDNTQFYRETGGGVTGFGGVRFFVHPRVSFALESGLMLGYARKLDRRRRQEGDTGLDVQFSTETDNIQAAILAKRFMTMNFHF